MGNYSAERIRPEKAALIVVDVQNDYCHEDGNCAQRGYDTSDAREMVPRLQALVSSARQTGMKIVFIQTKHDGSLDSESWLYRTGDREVGSSPTPSNCIIGSWGEEFYGVKPESDDTVVNKYRYSAFIDTNLDFVLRNAGIEALIFTGVATNVCVESTLRDAVSMDYKVTLVSDCAASFDPTLHDVTLVNVSRYFGQVLDSTQLTATWEELTVSEQRTPITSSVIGE